MMKKDAQSCQEMVDYAEPQAGNRALNFAVLTGNQKMIDFVLNDMRANAKLLT